MARPHRPALRASLVLWAVAAVLLAGAYVWSGPRGHVPLPGPGATPTQVVRACIDAVNKRDFRTANAIDSRPDSDLDRFSNPLHTADVRLRNTVTEGDEAHVLFTADFSGGDGTVQDGWWGYYLRRGSDGRWHITDAGVA